MIYKFELQPEKPRKKSKLTTFIRHNPIMVKKQLIDQVQTQPEKAKNHAKHVKTQPKGDKKNLID